MIVPLLAALAGAMAAFVAVGSLTGQFAFTQRRLAARAVTFQRLAEGEERRGKPRGLEILKDDNLAGNPAVGALLRRFAWASSRARRLESADLPLKVSEYLLILGVVFGALTVAAGMLSGLLFVGPAFGLAGVIMTEVWVSSRASRRVAAFGQQLPVALQSMAVSLKSGFGIMEAVATVSREMDRPLSAEFSRMLDEARLGGSFEAGLAAMVERVNNPDLRIVSRAIDIHRKVGGDLASILENVATTMREREELRGHVRALTAQQRTSGLIIALLPIWVVGFFSVASPEFISPLWEETTGRLLFAGAAAMELVAVLAMRKVMSIEV
jgi:tight adherence protein B